MKNTILLLCLLFSVQTFAQRSVNKFYREFKNSAGARSIAVPGFMFKIGSVIAKKHVDEDDETAVMGVDLMKKIKGMRVLAVEDYSPANDADIKKFTEGVYDSGFDNLFMFKNAETDVHFMMRDDGDKIKNLVILVRSEENGLMLMNMKSKLKKSEIAELIKTTVKNANDSGDDYYDEVEPEVEKPKEEEKKPVKKTPRA